MKHFHLPVSLAAFAAGAHSARVFTWAATAAKQLQAGSQWLTSADEVISTLDFRFCLSFFILARLMRAILPTSLWEQIKVGLKLPTRPLLPRASIRWDSVWGLLDVAINGVLLAPLVMLGRTALEVGPVAALITSPEKFELGLSVVIALELVHQVAGANNTQQN